MLRHRSGSAAPMQPAPCTQSARPFAQETKIRAHISVLAFDLEGRLLLREPVDGGFPLRLEATASLPMQEIREGDKLVQRAWEATAEQIGSLLPGKADSTMAELRTDKLPLALVTVLADPRDSGNFPEIAALPDAVECFHFVFVLPDRLNYCESNQDRLSTRPNSEPRLVAVDPKVLGDSVLGGGLQPPKRERPVAVDAHVEQVVRLFHPLEVEMKRCSKHTLRAWPQGTDRFPHAAADLQLYHLLDPVTYMFDMPGKGVRSAAILVLAQQFAIASSDVSALMHCVDRFHEASLVIDDIEDNSAMRRDSDAAHVRFGIPLALNAGYMSVFAMLDSVPRLFRRHHDATLRLLVTGFVEGHRGQGSDIFWREHNYCPTQQEYVEMIRGKTSTPFVAAASLFFLHTTDWRLRLLRVRDTMLAMIAVVFWGVFGWVWSVLTFWRGSPSTLASEKTESTSVRGVSASPRARWGTAIRPVDTSALAPLWALTGPLKTFFSSEERLIITLYDRIGIFFQIRDDYINLTDPEYWEVKGFCDDLHEKKYSYPVVLMIRGRMGRWEDIMRLYACKEELSRAQLEEALGWVTDSGALSVTRDHLLQLQSDIRADVEHAKLSSDMEKLLRKLVVK